MPSDPQIKIAVLEQKISGIREAIELQAREYERRLTELNHAHAKEEARNAQSVTRELFDTKLEQQQRWNSQIESALAESKGGKAAILSAVGIVISVAAVVLSLLSIFKG